MSTVAYRDGVMVADGQITLGGRIALTAIPKVVRYGNWIIGTVGDEPTRVALQDRVKKFCEQDIHPYSWRQGPFAPPKGEADMIAVRETPEGLTVFHMTEKLRYVTINAPFFAVGSGGDYAMGAMGAGADAVKAVRIAKDLDPSTGEPVFLEAFLVAKDR